jgi:Protein of unknown function (DUF2934)
MPRATKVETPAAARPRLVSKSETKSTRTKPVASPESLHELITKRAYELFLQDGAVHGRHVEHWVRAEQEIMAAARPTKKVAASTAS